MRLHLTSLLIIICTSLSHQTTAQGTAKDEISSAVSAVLSGNKEAYLSNVYTKSAVLYRATKGRKLSADEQKKGKEFIDGAYGEYVTEQSQKYASISKKVKELGINWELIKIDSISIQPDEDDNVETNSGTIYFRKTDNSSFYKMNYVGVMKFENRYYIESFLTPYVYDGAKNRVLTASIKKQFIDTCIKTLNVQMATSEVLKNAFGKCPPCHCEKQYVSETEQHDGVQRVKKYISAGVPRFTTKKK